MKLSILTFTLTLFLALTTALPTALPSDLSKRGGHKHKHIRTTGDFTGDRIELETEDGLGPWRPVTLSGQAGDCKDTKRNRNIFCPLAWIVPWPVCVVHATTWKTEHCSEVLSLSEKLQKLSDELKAEVWEEWKTTD